MPSYAPQLCGRVLIGFQAFGFDPVNLRFQIVSEAAMNQRFAQTLVGVFEFDVLADDADRNFVHRIVNALDKHFPCVHAAFGLRQIQHADDLIVESFGAEHRAELRKRFRHLSP